MPTLTKGWFETSKAFEDRKVAEEKKAQDAFDASIKDGTIGRVINDPEEQRRVAKYRQEQAQLRKQQTEETAKLNVRRQMAKDFQHRQELETKSQAQFPNKPLPAVAERLSLWKPKRFQVEDQATQTLGETRNLRNV